MKMTEQKRMRQQCARGCCRLVGRNNSEQATNKRTIRAVDEEVRTMKVMRQDFQNVGFVNAVVRRTVAYEPVVLERNSNS